MVLLVELMVVLAHLDRELEPLRQPDLVEVGCGIEGWAMVLVPPERAEEEDGSDGPRKFSSMVYSPVSRFLIHACEEEAPDLASRPGDWSDMLVVLNRVANQ